MHLTIAMLTYRRNDYLVQVIPELLAQADDVCDAQTTASVLIVDNDPQAGARALRVGCLGGGGDVAAGLRSRAQAGHRGRPQPGPEPGPRL